MDRYICDICGYIYDPEEGDPEGEVSIPPGTAFEDLPEGWTCPACGIGVERFFKET